MRDWRDCRVASNCAKRLECGVFTAAFRCFVFFVGFC
jgi:hypothetical protein